MATTNILAIILLISWFFFDDLFLALFVVVLFCAYMGLNYDQVKADLTETSVIVEKEFNRLYKQREEAELKHNIVSGASRDTENEK